MQSRLIRLIGLIKLHIQGMWQMSIKLLGNWLIGHLLAGSLAVALQRLQHASLQHVKTTTKCPLATSQKPKMTEDDDRKWK